jgi:hypothetical protein
LFMLYCICLELLVLMTMDKGAAFIWSMLLVQTFYPSLLDSWYM